MSPSLSPIGEGLTMHSKLRSYYQPAKPEVKINLSGDSKRRTYTTLDKLEGSVAVTPSVDTPFDEVEVEFVGTSRTYVERMTTAAAISGRSEAFHQFLKLQQPDLEQHYPEGRILKAGRTYEFPFVFVVPAQLLPKVCRHNVVSPSLRDAHLQLPPTFGDRDSADKTDAVDDMVPDMASVRYGVFARVSKNKDSGNEIVPTTVAAKAARLRVLPAADEQPPLDVSSKDSVYTMRKEKPIKKGVLKGKLGTLVMEAAQPPLLSLKPETTSEPQSSLATIMLRFDPVDESVSPPRLGSLSNKLKVCTYFASTARQKFPCKDASLTDMSQGLHTEQLNLSSRCMNNVEWTKHDSAKSEMLERRDSGCSVASASAGLAPEASETYKGRSFYVARLLVPITLPKHKSFVPTFHSCLISREYQLKLELGLQGTGIGGGLELKVPFQIACERTNDDPGPQRGMSVESAMEAGLEGEDDVGEFFELRTYRAGSEGFPGRDRLGNQSSAQDAPPDYSPVAFRRTADRRRSVF